MKNELLIRILTKGERPEILLKIEKLKLHLTEKSIPYSIAVSLNFDQDNPPFENIESSLTSLGVTWVRQPKFIDSVEQHMLESYRTLDRTKYRGWVWLMDDSDLYEDEGFDSFITFLYKTKKQIIFVNSGFEDLHGNRSDPKILSLRGDSPNLLEIILNSGPPHAASKLGAWVVHTDLLEPEYFEVWDSWLEKTILWTHVYFFLLVLTSHKEKGHFYNECILYSSINPTDVDTNPNWLKWHQRTNKIFQQDWTFGQIYILKYFIEHKYLTFNQVKFMTVSDSQRGVLPFYLDLLFRLVINQLPEALLYKRGRIDSDLGDEFFSFLSEIYPPHKELLKSCAAVMSNSKVRLKFRLEAYKYARFTYDMFCINPWLIFRQNSFINFDIYARQSGYFALHKSINPNVLFRDTSEVAIQSKKIAYSNQLSDVRKKIANSKELYYTNHIDYFPWEIKTYNPELRFPNLQLFILRLSRSKTKLVRKTSLKLRKTAEFFLRN
jgi:hypothetical protein